MLSVMGEPVASEPRLFVGQVRSLVSPALLTLPSGTCAAQAARGGPRPCGASMNLYGWEISRLWAYTAQLNFYLITRCSDGP